MGARPVKYFSNDDDIDSDDLDSFANKNGMSKNLFNRARERRYRRQMVICEGRGTKIELLFCS